MATIRERIDSDGAKHYQVQVRLRGHPTQTKSFARRTDAKQWAIDIEAKMRNGADFPTREAKRHTLDEAIDDYLKHVEKQRAYAHGKQSQLLNWWKGRIGAYALANIRPSIISAQRDALLEENIGTEDAPVSRSPATVNRYLAALSSCFSYVVKRKHWISTNPMRGVAKESEGKGRERFLSDAERTALLEACGRSELPELRLVVLLALTTGMRRGEIMGLRWPDVDLQRGVATLRDTKNGDTRAARLMPDVAALLREHGKVRRFDTDLVFPRKRRAAPIDFDHPFADAVKAAGIEDFRFHDLRHTAASYLAMSGATLAEIATVLGHRTLAMVKRYSHLTEQHTAGVLDRMHGKYFGNTG